MNYVWLLLFAGFFGTVDWITSNKVKHPWLYFILAQFVQVVATVIGWLILWIFCVTKAWTSPNSVSIKDKRSIDCWKWSLLNYVYGNPEDGVSGQQALIWLNGVQTTFMSTTGIRTRAYIWSALRNSCDNLKYVFALPGGGDGPMKYWKGFKFGYQNENGFNVPVIGRK